VNRQQVTARTPRRFLLRGLVLPALAVSALGYAAIHIGSNSRPITQTEPVVEPPRSPFAGSVAGVGMVEPRTENISVAAVVPGTVVEVAAREGKNVAAGDVLFRLDGRQRRSTLAVREAQLVEAEATLRRWQEMPRPEDLPPSAARVRRFQADLKLREDQLRRARQLAQQRVITDQELVEREQAESAARAELTQAEAEDARLRAGAWEADLAVARSQVEHSRQLVEQARVELDRLVVRAPIGGTVLKVDVRPGEYVGTPPGKPLVLLGDIDVLHVRVDVDEQDLPRFSPGMSGRGFVRGDANTPLTLRFVRVEPFAEPKQSLTGAGNERIDTRVLQVIYAIDSPPRNVYVGQQVDVFLDPEGGRQEQAMVNRRTSNHGDHALAVTKVPIH
jgi:multidrug efflux pump subunit AcrA (membrane-fusion protein)